MAMSPLGPAPATLAFIKSLDMGSQLDQISTACEKSNSKFTSELGVSVDGKTEEIAAAVVTYKRSTAEIISKLGLPLPCKTKDIPAAAAAHKFTSHMALQDILCHLDAAIKNRQLVSGYHWQLSHGKKDRQWIKHQHFIDMLVLARQNLTGSKLGSSGQLRRIPVTPSLRVHNALLASSKEASDFLFDNFEGLIDACQKCTKVVADVIIVWDQLDKAGIDYISTAMVTNCAYGIIKATLALVEPVRVICGHQFEKKLLEIVRSFGMGEAVHLYEAITADGELNGDMGSTLQYSLRTLNESLAYHSRHNFQQGMPFLQDLISHIHSRCGCVVTICFGLTIYHHTVTSIFSGVPFKLRHTTLTDSKKFLASTYYRTLCNLLIPLLSDPEVKGRTEKLATIFGISTEGILSRINHGKHNKPPEDAVLSELCDLDLWSLGHQLGRLHWLQIKLASPRSATPRAAGNLTAFVYVVNYALLQTGLKYEPCFQSVMRSQDQRVFRQSRPTTIDELETCLRNTITPGTQRAKRRKIHKRRQNAMHKDFSVSLLAIICEADFVISNEMKKWAACDKSHATDSVLWLVAKALNAQMESSYNIIFLDGAAKKVLSALANMPRLSHFNRDITKTMLRETFSHMTHGEAAELAKDMQMRMWELVISPQVKCTFVVDEAFYLPRMPVPRTSLVVQLTEEIRPIFYLFKGYEIFHQHSHTTSPLAHMMLEEFGPQSRNRKILKAMIEQRFGKKFYLQAGSEAEEWGVNPQLHLSWAGEDDLGMICMW